MTCVVGALAAGEVVTITLTGAGTEVGALKNTASVVANELEIAPADNASSAAPAVIAPAAAIPTAGETGLLLLAIVLAAAGALAIRST